MIIQGFVVTLLDPVALPTQAATASRPQTLTYLPGASFLGIAAAKLYDALNQNAFAAFHSGAIRFEDAFPVQNSGHICLPAPLSLHHPKSSAAGGRATAQDMRDFAAESFEPNYKQIRGKDVTLDGKAEFYTPPREASMRTAIDFDTGLADEGQLYGYEALSPGQRFRGRIVGDDDMLAKITGNSGDFLAKITQALIGEHFIGRSRTAEYGRIEITLEDTAWTLPAEAAASGQRYVWLLSDMWLHDACGLPTNRPTSETFGTKSIDWAHSFVRTRRVAPYNAKWAARGEARDLITRGSVLTLEGCALSPGLHHFGMGQERGYGLAFVSAEPLRELLKHEINPLSRRADAHSAEPVPTQFSSWLEGRLERVQAKQRAATGADGDLAALRKHYAAARHLAGEPVGPGASQWAGLATRLSDEISVDTLLGEADDRDSKQWGARFKSGTEESGTFRGFVQGILKSEDDPARLRHLAAKARRAIDAEHWLEANGAKPKSGGKP